MCEARYGERMARAKPSNSQCSIARSLGVLGQRWTLLIVREALDGRTRFGEFQERLSISTDVLADRLESLVEAEVLEKRPYRDGNARERQAYHLTDAGRELALVLAAFMTWGDKHLADASGPPALLRTSDGERPVRLVFVDDDDAIVPPGDVISVPAPRRAGGPRSRPANVD